MNKKSALRRIVACLLVLSMVFSWLPPDVFAASMTDIRVGLTSFYKDKPTIKITTTKIGMGYSIHDQYKCEVEFTSRNGFTLQVAKGSYFILDQKFSNYSEALAVAKKIEQLGVKAYPASIYRNTYQVYVGGESTTTEMERIRERLVTNTAYSYQGPYADNGHRLILLGENVTLLIDGKTKAAYPQFKAISLNSTKVATMDLGARQYRGRIEVGRYGKSGLTAVNIINLESYLYSVVPSEMVSSWPIESLKAQAVCARSYAMSKTSYGTDSNILVPYKITDTTKHQSYKGYGAETTRTTHAVKETKGYAVTYKNKVICAYYSSTSGGRTESSFNVWGSRAPYLQGVVDEYESEPEKGPWVIAMTKSELSKKLANAGIGVGNVTNVTVVSVTNSGRVSKLKVFGEDQSRIIEKEKIRSVLDLYSTKFKIVKSGQNSDEVVALGSNGMTKVDLSNSYVLDGNGKTKKLGNTSNRIYIVKSSGNLTPFIKEAPESEDIYYFVGQGFGHGVGMSQSGAKGLAKNGYSYKKILQYYFKGCSIQKIY